MFSADGEPAVLHFVERWLEPSAQFVYGHVSRSRRRSVVASALRPVDADRFPISPLVSLAWTERLPPAWARRARTARLLVLASRHDVGIVHCHFGYRFTQVRSLVERRNVPWVVSLHGQDVIHLRQAVGEERSALGRTDAVVVPSGFLAEMVIGVGVSRERVHVIPSGVDVEFFAARPLPPGVPEAVFVGRFVEKKGLDVLASAWPTVRRAVPEARLRLLGYGPLESVARSIGSGTEVVLRPDRHAVRDALERARVVVTPSRTAADGDVESLLLVNLEAQAMGRPVVTTDHGGIPEYVRAGETGLIVPEDDPDALADALIGVLRDQALAERLGRAGTEWAVQFDVRTCSAEVDGLYDTLMGPAR